MVKINCWNEYSNLKTIILASCFENDKIPNLYSGIDQENFVKIVEETNKELAEIQKIFEQNNVNVLRPKQPKNYNGAEIIDHSPMMNMRDFFMAYGDIFFMTYGTYKTRRFQHLWLEDICHELIMDGNLIVNANELNYDGGIPIDYNTIFDNAEDYFSLINMIHPKKASHAKSLIKNMDKVKTERALDWFINHMHTYKNKNIFHTASIQKHNKICFMSTYNGTLSGNKWIENWLSKINVKIIYVPYIGHIDATSSILNNDSIICSDNEQGIAKYFKNVFVPIKNPQITKIVKTKKFMLEKNNPTNWLTEWQGYYQEFNKNVNGVSINPNLVMLTFYDKDFYAKLKNHGIDIIYTKWTNAEFWGGGLHCMTCDIERE